MQSRRTGRDRHVLVSVPFINGCLCTWEFGSRAYLSSCNVWKLKSALKDNQQLD